MFLNPLLLLAGLAALAIPIYVHLQQRRQKVRVVFSSLRLVEESQRIARRRRRITNWPLFLLRCLAVGLLAFVFGRPLLTAFQADTFGRKETVAFVVDRSGSMHATGEVGSSWDEALGIVRQAVNRSNPASQVTLITTPAHDETGSVRWHQPLQLASELTQLKPGYGRADLPRALGRAASALARADNDMPKVLHLVSDLQADAIRDLERVTLPANIAIRVTKVGDLEPANSGLVAGVRGKDELRRGVYGFRGTGDSTTASGAVEIQEIGVDSKPVGEPEKLVPEAGKPGITRSYTASQRGWYGRTVQLLQEDALSLDNIVYDSFYVQSRVDVILVEPRINVETFNQATFFFSRALDPFVAEDEQTRKATRFVPRVVSALTAASDIAEADATASVAFLPATTRMTRELGDALQGFVKDGGGLILFNGTDVPPALYEQYLGELLPVQIGTTEGLQGRVTLEIVTDSHPLWGELDENSRRRMSQVPLFKRSAVELKDGSHSVATYSDGMPLVVERAVGKGRVLFVNTTADRQWGDWQTQGGLFVPTVHVLAGRALPSAESEQRNASVQLTVDLATGLDVGKAYSGATVEVGNERFLVDAEGIISDTAAWEPGLYSVKSDAGTVIRQFAVNVPLQESNLDSVQGVVIKRQLEAQRAQSGDVAAVLATSSESTSTLWKFLLVALIFMLAIEPWLANRY